METPVLDDLRRLTLINASSSFESPLRRRSNVPPSTPVLEPVNDEEERNTRRSLVGVHKRVSSIIPSGQSPLSEVAQIIDESQIKDHLRICTKLYTENRISSKNAWQLHVIDVMKKIASTDNANALQVAGSSLDIGTKVYSLRVDDLHTKGLQLASSMTKSDEKKQNEDDTNDDDNKEPLDQTRTKRNVRKKIKKLAADKRSVIDKEGTGLLASVKQVESVVFSTKENIEVCATDNLFTHKLPTNPDTHLFMQMSDEKYWHRTSDSNLKNDEVLDGLDLPQIKNFNMCLAIKEFEIGTWSRELEEKQLVEAHSVLDPVVDDHGVPVPELDGSVRDIFEENYSTSDVEEQGQEEVFQAQIYGELVHISDAVPEGERTETDYGYNKLLRTKSGKYIDKIWAGPSHWKVKFNKRSTAKFSGSTTQSVKHARKTKTQQKVVFQALVDDVCEAIEKHVAKRTGPKTTFDKTTLPVPECFDKFGKQIDELLLKPNVMRPSLSRGHTDRDRQPCETQEYNYDNPNDSLYCSRNNIDGELLQDSVEENVVAVPEQNFLSDNLVHAPELVSASQVPYAMQAKKMDMRKLKTAIWKRLEHDEQGNVTSADFSDVYADLPRSLSSDMKKELTCPLAFVALLHLCNDHELMLHKKPDCNDFTICKAKD